MKNARIGRTVPLFLMLAVSPALLYADCLSPNDSYEVMACKTTAAFATKHLARNEAEAQRRAVARGAAPPSCNRTR
jgi:hypothetical protein